MLWPGRFILIESVFVEGWRAQTEILMKVRIVEVIRELWTFFTTVIMVKCQNTANKIDNVGILYQTVFLHFIGIAGWC